MRSIAYIIHRGSKTNRAAAERIKPVSMIGFSFWGVWAVTSSRISQNDTTAPQASAKRSNSVVPGLSSSRECFCFDGTKGTGGSGLHSLRTAAASSSSSSQRSSSFEKRDATGATRRPFDTFHRPTATFLCPRLPEAAKYRLSGLHTRRYRGEWAEGGRGGEWRIR